MKQLLIATSNPGKLAEIKKYLSDVPIRLLGLRDVRISGKPVETGITFEENAILKAEFYAERSGLPAIGDDGGLEIDALNGAPGVKSHRWIRGDRDDDDAELIAYTLKQMKGLPPEKRGAQLRAVVALVLPDGRVFTTEEATRGVIAETQSKQYTKGFPYRSLLFLPAINKYYNDHELTEEENEVYNHRRKALEKLKPVIRKLLAPEDNQCTS